MHGAGLGLVGVGAAQLLHGDLFTGDGLDDVRSGDEHLAGLVDHDDEVGERGGVDVATGRGTHDERNLGDDTRRQDVVAEDAAVQTERDHTLLDAGAGAVVDADQGAAGLDGQLLDLDDLLAVDLAEAAAEDGGVLAEDADLAAVDGAVAGHHTVAERVLVSEAEVGAAVLGQRVEFDERALVQQRQDALAGGELALLVDLFHRGLADGVQGLFGTPTQVFQLACGGVDVDRLVHRWLGHARHGDDVNGSLRKL
ncbi:Uncharacterised protein [Mycobacteroides abscessus subsp. abscessus]|nr:Uncharacterised protein [Mycobacteroides abscessus subsp. abscessus]